MHKHTLLPPIRGDLQIILMITNPPCLRMRSDYPVRNHNVGRTPLMLLLLSDTVNTPTVSNIKCLSGDRSPPPPATSIPPWSNSSRNSPSQKRLTARLRRATTTAKKATIPVSTTARRLISYWSFNYSQYSSLQQLKSVLFILFLRCPLSPKYVTTSSMLKQKYFVSSWLVARLCRTEDYCGFHL